MRIALSTACWTAKCCIRITPMTKSKLILLLLLCAATCFAKMHISTDASDYRAGSRIWFRVHSLDARTLLPDTTTELLFVELINPQGEVTKRIKLLREDDIFCGYIDIPTQAVAGQYLLRSYPRGMDHAMALAGTQIVYIHGSQSSAASDTPQPQAQPEHSTTADSATVAIARCPLSAIAEANGTYSISISTDSLHTGERVLVSAAVTDRYAIARHAQWTIKQTFSLPPFYDPVLNPTALRASVRGRVLTPVSHKGISGALVNMIVPGTYYYASVTTDSKGQFLFDDELVPEGAQVLLTAYRPDGSQSLIIRTNEETFPPYTGIAPAGIHLDDNHPVTHAELYDITDSVMLDEIQVNAKRLIKETEREQQSMYVADASFGVNKIEEYNATCLHDLLRRVPGVRVENEQCFIRGAHSIYAKNPAAIAINGVLQEDMYDLDLIPMQDIARLDIFKSGTTAIWGSRGGAGVISIILKDGTEIPKQTSQTNLKRFAPLGWQQPQAFYLSPEAISQITGAWQDTRKGVLPVTILWEPNVRSQTLRTIIPTGSPNDTPAARARPTIYDVVIEGVTTHGRLIREQLEIPVQ